ncbi:radical SAM protein [Candidatus Sumerlaeota bacterium]|nr:radical SAM protein [Candidatus Sumerlaeota bacterium]
MNKADYKYVYGPVPSRRLGRSLGIDLAPFKICTYDCIYCQLGRTTNKTMERREYSPFESILKELNRKLKEGASPDYISLAGSGEPTLNACTGKLIREIKNLTSIPVAVITNGSLLWMKEVQEELEPADVIMPSLDAGDDEIFQIVNRPHPDISFEKMTEGLVKFRERFHKPVWLEVFLLPNISGRESEVKKIAAIVHRIRPDKVQLNSIARPPAEKYASRMPDDSMESCARLFDVETEVISERRKNNTPPISASVTDDDVVALLSRRPCTARGVTLGLGINLNETVKIIQKLCEQGAIKETRNDKDIFYETIRKTE